MENQTEEVLSSILGSEFKVEVEKRDTILKRLNAQKTCIEQDIVNLGQELEDMNKRKESLKDELTLAYKNKEDALQQEKDNFTHSVANTTQALELKERLLDQKLAEHEQAVKEHWSKVSDLNKDKLTFDNKKRSIIETLNESLKTHTILLSDAINALQEPDEPTTPVL